MKDTGCAGELFARALPFTLTQQASAGPRTLDVAATTRRFVPLPLPPSPALACADRAPPPPTMDNSEHCRPRPTGRVPRAGCRLGGMCGAIVTSPFDVVKTRLQSDLFRQKHPHPALNVLTGGVGAVVSAPCPTNLLYNFVETGFIIR